MTYIPRRTYLQAHSKKTLIELLIKEEEFNIILLRIIHKERDTP